VEAAYGSVRALFGLSLEVREQEIVCMIGANGAGKTTTLRVVTGALPATRGEVEFLDSRSPASGCRTSYDWESPASGGSQGLQAMTVHENLEIGASSAAARSTGWRKRWTRFSVISRSCATGGRNCRNTLGWRTADAGVRASHDVPSQAAAAG